MSSKSEKKIGSDEKNAVDTSKTSQKRIKPNEAGKKFLDTDFPPDPKTLASDFSLIDESLRPDWETFIFKPIEDIFPQPIKVFNNINPNDILQGKLGNCYFLSSLSAMAEFPSRIQRCFTTQDYSPIGQYTINLFETGIPTTLTIDDYFPVTPNNKLAFSGPKLENGITELWVLLLEKAWAKRFGSYWAIDKGAIEDVLRDLTAAPCENISTADPKLWRKLRKASSKKFIIAAARLHGDSDDENEVNKQGLVNFHAYAVIDIRRVIGSKGKDKVVKIRNPWGRVEWNGDWSDASDLWTAELKQELGWENRDDGVFWMSFKDFAVNYNRVTVCKAKDEFFYRAVLQQQQPGEFSVFVVRVDGSGDVYFMLTHEDGRGFGEGFAYSSVRMVVARKDGDRLLRVSGLVTSDYRDSWVLVNADPGEYVVYVEVNWISASTNHFGFSVYSDVSVEITEETAGNMDFLQQVYSEEMIRSVGKETQVGDGVSYFEVAFDGESLDDICGFEGVYLDMFVNDSQRDCGLNVAFRKFENVEVRGEFFGKSEFRVEMKPKESVRIVKCRKDLRKTAEVRVNLKKLFS